MRSPYTIPTAIVCGGVVIAAAIYFSTPTPEAPTPTSTVTTPALMRSISNSDHILGNPAARVVMVTYCDFDSEFCRIYHDTLHQIIANQGTQGTVAWVFRHLPLTEMHPNALALARAAECAAGAAGNDLAAQNDAFWRFADALFDRQPVDPQALSIVAATAKVSGTSFASCYAHAPQAIETRIMTDRKNALAIGATGTPFAIIVAEGKEPVVVDGTYSYDALTDLIKKALRK